MQGNDRLVDAVPLGDVRDLLLAALLDERLHAVRVHRLLASSHASDSTTSHNGERGRAGTDMRKQAYTIDPLCMTSHCLFM